MCSRTACLAMMLAVAVAATLDPARAQPAGGAPSAPAAEAPVSGDAVFRRVCAACHLGLAQIEGASAGVASALDGHAVPRELMRQFPPQAIVNALTSGKMQAQGAALTEAERRAVAEYASGRSFSPASVLPLETEAGMPCTDGTSMGDPARGASWNGWGNGPHNTRFQSASQGGITAEDLPHLKLQWAFGYANVSSARAQPAVTGGRLFVASENGMVHALNPKTGCSYWSFKAQAGVSTALSVGRYHGASGTGSAVYFGDRRANAYAVDAQTGRQIWTRKIDQHASASITGAPTVYGGRVFVPVQGIGEESLGAHNNYGCCTFRGSVSALDASTGEVLWKAYTMPPSEPREKTASGAQTYGPAGGGIWSAPTVDARRHLVYVATGNGYADPPQPTTDAVLAFDLQTGALKWSTQVLKSDDWVMGCDAHNPDKPACPRTLGPDFDFSASPALVRLAGRELLVLPQKSGLAFALDPSHAGKLVWQYRFGQGSGLGGQWGTASDGERAYFGVGDALTAKPGGLHAVKLADGARAWAMPPPAPLCAERLACNVSQGGAVTVIPGAVLSGSLDGGLRAYAAVDGKVLWVFDTNRSFETVNGIPAHGGAIDGAGPIVVDGMLYVNSGVAGLMGQPGNVLLAFALEK